MDKFEKLNELTVLEAANINGGGVAWEWVGRWMGRINEVMKAAVAHGYEHAGLFH